MLEGKLWRNKENRKKKLCGLLFLWSDLSVQVFYFFISFILFLSLFVLKGVRHSLGSNSYVKSFCIEIHLIRSAEGTYLHWQVGSQTTSAFSKWKESSSRTSPTLPFSAGREPKSGKQQIWASSYLGVAEMHGHWECNIRFAFCENLHRQVTFGLVILGGRGWEPWPTRCNLLAFFSALSPNVK